MPNSDQQQRAPTAWSLIAQIVDSKILKDQGEPADNRTNSLQNLEVQTPNAATPDHQGRWDPPFALSSVDRMKRLLSLVVPFSTKDVLNKLLLCHGQCIDTAF